VLLLATAGYVGAGTFVVLDLGLARTAAPMYAVAGACGLLLGAGLAERRWPALALARRVSPRWPVVGLAVALSVTAAQMSDRFRETYRLPFALWLAALVLVLAAAVAPALVPHRESLPGLARWLRRHRWETAAVVLLLAAALALRLANLTSIPWPLSGDEAAHALWAKGLFWDRFSNVFESGLQGQPNAFYLGLAASLKLLGFKIMGARFLAAIFGAVTVPVFYLFLRQAFDRQVALVGAAYLTAYHFHVHFSRMGLNNVGEPLLLSLMMLLAWRAVTHGRPADFLLAGAVTGLSLYVSAGARIAALILAAFLGYVILTKRGFLRNNISNLGLVVAAYAVAALPLGLYWLGHQDQFMDRLNAVGIFQSDWFRFQVEDLGRSESSVLWEQVRRSFGAFGYYSDVSPFYTAPISFVERVSLVPFVVGVLYALFHVRQERYALLLLLFVGSVASGGVLTIQPPYASRLLPTIPAVAAFIAVGLVFICRTLSRPRPELAGYAMGIGVAVMVSFNIHFYFFDYTGGGYRPDLPAMVAQRLDPYVRGLPQGLTMYFYGAPVVITDFPSFPFLLQGVNMIDVTPEGQPERPVNSAGPAIFVFLPHRESELSGVQQRCPGGRTQVFTEEGRNIFTSYEAINVPCQPFPQVAR
jgi:4-amino-4-deoxy-L-arabinose transferase-like glycosyltransferase